MDHSYNAALHVHQMDVPIVALLWAVTARMAIETTRTLQPRGDAVEGVETARSGLRLRILRGDVARGEPKDRGRGKEQHQITRHTMDPPRDAGSN
jgi:hypothetical protein